MPFKLETWLAKRQSKTQRMCEAAKVRVRKSRDRSLAKVRTSKAASNRSCVSPTDETPARGPSGKWPTSGDDDRSFSLAPASF
jgi:hypothetical protein